MKLSVRIFFAYFVLLGFAIWFVMRSFSAELVPGMRQSLEEVLVDTANLLAELIVDEVAQGELSQGRFSEAMTAFSSRRLDARIWFLKKRDPNLIIYVTDAVGHVIYHSNGDEVGKDYSRWNDIYLTLRGAYGARTTKEDPGDEFSSVMYVAAPVLHNGAIIGVVSVGKPSVTVQPFIERMLDNIQEKGAVVILVALLMGVLIAYWLTLSIRQLTAYARGVRDGKRPDVPKIGERELAELAEAMDTMRRELEGKDYVERYLHSLTHELKSPLAAIQGTAELLNEDMPKQDRQRFLDNIRNEATRLHQVVEQLLRLAGVEKQLHPLDPEPVDTAALIESMCEERQWRLRPLGIKLQFQLDEHARPVAEKFLLQVALRNCLDNAIDFSANGGVITLTSKVVGDQWQFTLCDQGPGVPEYARERIFERFYSLPRPDGSCRSSGLGLSFVREVVLMHGGEISVNNRKEGGAVCHLVLPMMPTH